MVQIDVWAAGIILYILLCGFPPFVSPDNEQEPLFDAILSGVYEFPEPYWNDIGQEVRDLIANMLQLGNNQSLIKKNYCKRILMSFISENRS